jgi:hypothetical protein
MSHAPDPIDASVIIDRVLVRVGDCGPCAPAEIPEPARSRSRDHRIIVGELRIDTDAPLDAQDARRLGDRIARALCERLDALQPRRVEATLAGRAPVAPIRIGALRVNLRGSEAERPNLSAITASLADAIERRI